MAAQESFLVGVEDGNQRYFRQVESLAQEVYADEDIIHAGAQSVENLYAVHGLDVGVDVGRLYFHFGEVLVQFLRHALCEGCHQSALAAFDAGLYFLHEVVDLVERRLYLYQRVEKSGGAYHLFGHHTLAPFKLIVGRCGAHIYHLPCYCLEFLEFQRPVVQCGRQAEAVFHKVDLAGAVAPVHGPQLRHRYVALVDYREEVLREVVEQAERTVALAAAVEIARVVLDAGAVSEFFYHLHVVVHPFLDSLRLEQPCFLAEMLDLTSEVELNLGYGCGLALR